MRKFRMLSLLLGFRQDGMRRRGGKGMAGSRSPTLASQVVVAAGYPPAPGRGEVFHFANKLNLSSEAFAQDWLRESRLPLERSERRETAC